MNLSLLRYRTLDTPVHRLDPRTKLFWAVSVTAMAFIFYQPLPLLVILASVLPAAILSRSLLAWLRMMSWFAIAAVFIVSFNALLVPGETLASFATPWFTLSVTAEGLVSGIAMSIRLLAAIGAFLVMVFTTHPNDLAEGLRRFGLPGWTCFAIGTAFRFVPSVVGDFRMVQDAQLSRGLRTGRGVISMAKSTVPILVPAFALSIRRSQLLAEALESRGYTPMSNRTTLYPLRMKFVDACIVASCITVISVGVAVRILFT